MNIRVPKQDRTVREIEIVETYNLYRSLSRIMQHGASRRWKRALIHALDMCDVVDPSIKAIREALGIP